MDYASRARLPSIPSDALGHFCAHRQAEYSVQLRRKRKVAMLRSSLAKGGK
jgi:hypothetical protein